MVAGRRMNDRSHALRGHASRDALRHIPKRNAERPWRHSHAERGNDHSVIRIRQAD